MQIDNNILELKLKGFSDEEILRLLKKEKITKTQIKNVSVPDDIREQSKLLYSFMQKDLATSVMLELSKKASHDPQIVFNAIKLQVELQQKKIDLAHASTDADKISKSWLRERDEQISNLITLDGTSLEDVAKQFNISVLSVKQALDRVELGIDFDVSPSIISETKGLPKKQRVEIIKEAFSKKLTRDKVRKIVIKIKNKVRGR